MRFDLGAPAGPVGEAVNEERAPVSDAPACVGDIIFAIFAVKY